MAAVNNVGTNIRKPTAEYTEQVGAGKITAGRRERSLQDESYCLSLSCPANVHTSCGVSMAVRKRNMLDNTYPMQDYSFLMSTNLESAFRLCQMFYPLLKAAGSSCILFNSSVAGGPTALR